MATQASMAGVPDHVPPHLVGTFNLYTSPQMVPTPMGDPQAATSALHAGPPVFYIPNNTRNGEGTWIIVRAEDQRRVLQVGHEGTPGFVIGVAHLVAAHDSLAGDTAAAGHDDILDL